MKQIYSVTAQVTCPRPVAPTNGWIATSTTSTYPVGSTVRFTCNPGYTLSGSASTTCQTGGTWSAPFPTCTGKIGTTKQFLSVASFFLAELLVTFSQNVRIRNGFHESEICALFPQDLTNASY